MDWLAWVLLGIAAAGGVAWWLRGRRSPDELPRPAPARPAAPVRPATPRVSKRPARQRSFYGASIQPGANACDAAKALRDKRFLANEVPKLPLPDCDVATCKCQVVPHSDRRSGHDRRDSFSAYGDFHPDLDHPPRPRGPGRRKDD